MNDNNIIDLADRRVASQRPAPWSLTSERVMDLAMQATLLPTTLSLSEIEILGAAILAHGKGRSVAQPLS